MEKCIYCGTEINRDENPYIRGVVVPFPDDNEWWGAEINNHESECEWIRTRGHYLNSDGSENEWGLRNN